MYNGLSEGPVSQIPAVLKLIYKFFNPQYYLMGLIPARLSIYNYFIWLSLWLQKCNRRDILVIGEIFIELARRHRGDILLFAFRRRVPALCLPCKYSIILLLLTRKALVTSVMDDIIVSEEGYYSFLDEGIL